MSYLTATAARFCITCASGGTELLPSVLLLPSRFALVMQSLSHCSWLTRILIRLLKNRPDVFELHVRVPRPLNDTTPDDIDFNPEDIERQLTVGHLFHCYALESAATETEP